MRRALCLVWMRPHVSPSYAWYVAWQVCVDGGYRRRGIASAVMTRLLDISLARGAPVATLQASEEGAAVYERLGFQRVALFKVFMHFASASS